MCSISIHPLLIRLQSFLPMASSRCSQFHFLFLLLLLVSTAAEASGTGSLPPSQCRSRCTYRCSATSHKKPCMFFCLKCCAACRCVPPGTYGNKQVCPCYNNWKTQEGRPKCP